MTERQTPVQTSPTRSRSARGGETSGAKLTPDEAYSILADEYDASFRAKKDLTEDWLIGTALKAVIWKRETIVDIGCGTGAGLEILTSVGCKPMLYIGMDPARGMIRKAIKKFAEDIGSLFMIQDPADAWSVQRNGADAVVSLYSPICYSDRPRSIVKQMQRALKPGAPWMVMLYGPKYPKRRSYIINRKGWRVPVTTYTADAACKLLAPLGPLTVWGFSAWLDWIPRWMPQWVFDAWALAEAVTVGRHGSDRCHFIVAQGRKNG